MPDTDLSRQHLPRRPFDYDDAEPSELPPLGAHANQHVTTDDRPRARGRLEAEPLAPPPTTMIFNESAITRTDIWIAVAASSAIAVVIAELLHAVGLVR